MLGFGGTDTVAVCFPAVLVENGSANVPPNRAHVRNCILSAGFHPSAESF
jgi:hypothetical protein